VSDVADRHADCLHHSGGLELQHDRLCELNVLEQVVNVCQTTIVRDAWARGQELTVHGWVYSLKDGRVHHLGMDIDTIDCLSGKYDAALARIRQDRENR
jgi:carbonic anhydrase